MATKKEDLLELVEYFNVSYLFGCEKIPSTEFFHVRLNCMCTQWKKDSSY